MHQFIFLLLTFSHVTFNLKSTEPKLMKPDFAPYCVTRDICWPDCECTISTSCEIIPMSKRTKEKVLKFMNQKREMQASGEPAPAGMPMLTYNHQLEEVSKCWAAKCENLYSECFQTERFAETSQSVGQITLDENVDPGPNLWLKMIDIWFSESISLSHETLTNFPAGRLGERIHNFAQMVSDRVLYVGCSWSVKGSTVTFVCTFGPRGPTQGEAIYRAGEICTGCLKGYICNFQKPFRGLCKRVQPETEIIVTTLEITTETAIAKKVPLEDHTKSSSKLFKATVHDPDTDKEVDFTILWLFALGLILLVLICVIVFVLYYVLRLSTITSC
ncbi:venom allergen 5-like [Harmonia axyridis]|uniref:venom allergen 5-like n=1 Tax=Harmonia axyridis TaxID=115357 RepID=UPI001E274E13|nr:venom allergen 5-like [Harmonia axyridis]